METQETQVIEDVRTRLVEAAGRTTRDLGMGRIVGQILADVYFSEEDRALDDMAQALDLSKAAVSIAARKLETLGLLQRVWKKGDRKSYYRTVEHFGVALQHGLLSTVRGRVRTAGAELDEAEDALKKLSGRGKSPEARFIRSRLKRARTLRDRVTRILESPILKLLGR